MRQRMIPGLILGAVVVGVVVFLILNSGQTETEATLADAGGEAVTAKVTTAADMGARTTGETAGTADGRPKHPVFRVPEPGDPEYEDWKEMMKHFRSSVENSPGYAIPYDPEWRAALRGRRDVPVHDLVLAGGAYSMEELAQELISALNQRDLQTVVQLRISKDDFQLILFPEFPESRPYQNIPPDEAWGFHLANLREGAMEIVSEYGGKTLVLEDIKIGKVKEFTNFKLYMDIVLETRNQDTNQAVRIEMANSIVECKGRYKFYAYGT